MFNYTPREELEAQNKQVLSPSRLMAFAVSPQNYKSKYILKESEPTEAMVTGSVIHKAILEMETFDDVYAVLEPKENFLVTIQDLKEEIERQGATPTKGNKDKLIEQLLSLDDGAKIYDVYLEKMETCGKQIVSNDLWKRCKRIIEEIGAHAWLGNLAIRF